MAKKLIAQFPTIIKQSTLDSTQLKDYQKFSLATGKEIAINDYKSSLNNHWEITLSSPINGVSKWFAYKPHVLIKENSNYVKLKGKMSTFGGPEDFGVSPSEGLALIEPHQLPEFKDYFLPSQPPNTTGLARRLNPDTFYLACRWKYQQTSKNFLIKSLVTVTNPNNGKTAQAKPVDWGPNENTGRIADLSPGLAKFLGLRTDDTVEVIIPLASR